MTLLRPCDRCRNPWPDTALVLNRWVGDLCPPCAMAAEIGVLAMQPSDALDPVQRVEAMSRILTRCAERTAAALKELRS